MAFSVAMSATACECVRDSRFTYLFRWDRSTHIRMSSESFCGVTTIAGGAPFCRISDRGDDVLSFKDLELSLQLVFVAM